LLVRYGTDKQGQIVRKAHIYTADEHGILSSQVDPDAVRVIRRLTQRGFSAYIVGGAVRDLLTGRAPKDFDIATDAFPKQICKLIPKSRIIGRRFRIVHVYIYRRSGRKILEVATFRSKHSGSENTLYGPIEEDVWRRDFTINALYYCPLKGILLDYVGGLEDIRQKRLRTLVPVETSLAEDPVRMIRGAKYAVLTEFPLTAAMGTVIKKYGQRLRSCSPERVTEELYKILKSGKSAAIMESLHRLKLLEVVLPQVNQHWRNRGARRAAFSGLQELDRRIIRQPECHRGIMLAHLFKGIYGYSRDLPDSLRMQQMLRADALPLKPSKKELEKAAEYLSGSRI
jgi:poly(A) polymerase